MDLERHRGILETILSRAKDEEDVVKRLSNYMALLHYCYEEADEVRGYFTLVLEEKGLDTLQIASLINKSGKRYASTRLTAKAEKRLAEVQARIARGDPPDSYAYELFTELEARKSREAINPLLSPIQVNQAKRTSRMMSGVRSLFKAAKVIGLSLIPAVFIQKLSAAGSVGATGGATVSATAGAVTTGGAVAAPAGAGLATVIPIAAGTAHAAAPIVAPIATKVVAGWVSAGLVFGATGVVAYEATAGKPVVPVAQTVATTPDQPHSGEPSGHDPARSWLDKPTDSPTPTAEVTPQSAEGITPSPQPKMSQSHRPSVTTASPTHTPQKPSPMATTTSSTPTPAVTTTAPAPPPDIASTPTPESPLPSPTATPQPTIEPSGSPTPDASEHPPASPISSPEPSPSVTGSTPTASVSESPATLPEGDESAEQSGLLSWIADVIG
ncbi:hypothetical protein [Nonomuraea sp. CA-141351]|uniref:hypothetical protein n=1 Tax=Nonomuraea sp. CA-141351 TaxID=3239996 RepID=UPI003D901FD4